jgi:hypothetical protein
MNRHLFPSLCVCFFIVSSLGAQNAPPAQNGAQPDRQAVAPEALTPHRVEGNMRVTGSQTVDNSISKLPRVDVRHPDFGTQAGCPNAADPTGRNDSACAMQAAVKFAVSAGIANGGYPALYIPSGTYKISSTIRIPCELNVYGDGKIATVIEPVNNRANGITIYSDPSVKLPAEADCSGSLEDLTIDSPNGHNYTADLLSLSGIPGYNLNHVRLANGGGRGLNMAGERISSYDLEVDSVRWPIVSTGNEVHFFKTNIAAPGEAEDNYCYGANCVNGVYPSPDWSGTMTLRSASGDGRMASFVVSCTPETKCPSHNGHTSPIVAGHWFYVSGVTGQSGLNGYYQATEVRNNVPAGSFTVTAASTVRGDGETGSAKWQPAILPEKHNAISLTGYDVEYNGGSIKTTWDAGCFQVAGSQVVTIENFYCEGYPINGQPHAAASITIDGPQPYTILADPMGSSCSRTAPCVEKVSGGTSDGTMWMAPYETDVAADGRENVSFLYVYPPDYDPRSTAASASVSGVKRNQYEVIQGVFGGDGDLHTYARGLPGSTVAGTPSWPAGSYVQYKNEAQFGPQVISISNHFEAENAPGPNWAVYCKDSEGNSSVHSCADLLVGQEPDGVLIYPPGVRGASLPDANITLLNTSLVGAAGSENEPLGAGWVKVHSRGEVSVLRPDGMSGRGETGEVETGQIMASPLPVTAVQYSTGTSASMTYSNPTRETTIAVNPAVADSWYESRVLYENGADPVLGTNPGLSFAAGHQFSTSDCWYDVPADSGSTAHAQNSWCLAGEPGGHGSKPGWSYRIWNPTTHRWIDAFTISNSGNNTANVEITGTLKVNGGAAPAVQAGASGGNSGDSANWNNGGAPIAAHSCVAGPAANIAGASAGMEISVTPAANPGLGLTWNNAWPGNGRTVQAEICNVTAAAIVPRATSYHFRVSQ